jgi:hypothetical protein
VTYRVNPSWVDGYSAPVDSLTSAELDALVDEATVDCHNEEEQVTGFLTMIQDNLVLPFTTEVLGGDVTVRRVGLRGDDIVTICHRGEVRQRIEILDLPLPDPIPDGAQWIEAYRHWAVR